MPIAEDLTTTYIKIIEKRLKFIRESINVIEDALSYLKPEENESNCEG